VIPRQRVLSAALLVILGVVVMSACADSGLAPPAAVVNGGEISQADVQREVDVFLAITPEARTAFEGRNPTQRKEELNRSALEFMIQQRLVDGYAERKAVRATPSLLAQLYRETVQTAGGATALARQLAARGITQADVREFVRQVAVREAVAQSLSSDPAQQQQAFSSWLVTTARSADIDVNPRFGVLDEQTAEVAPLHSTAQLT
jgi:SurA-like protein